MTLLAENAKWKREWKTSEWCSLCRSSLPLSLFFSLISFLSSRLCLILFPCNLLTWSLRREQGQIESRCGGELHFLPCFTQTSIYIYIHTSQLHHSSLHPPQRLPVNFQVTSLPLFLSSLFFSLLLSSAILPPVKSLERAIPSALSGMLFTGENTRRKKKKRKGTNILLQREKNVQFVTTSTILHEPL